jgi:hypothetical protein
MYDDLAQPWLSGLPAAAVLVRLVAPGGRGHGTAPGRSLKRRTLLAAGTALPAASAMTRAVAAADAGTDAGAQEPRGPGKTLHLAFTSPEVTFDPPQTNSDQNTAIVLAQILEAPLCFDYLARPVRLQLATAAAMPEVSADGRVFTVQLQSGIYFADDPAFKGRPRELVAQDYVYSLKRYYDPRYNSSDLYLFESLKLPGLSELRELALKTRKPFDYDAKWKACARWTATAFASRWACPTRASSTCWPTAEPGRGGARGGGVLRRRDRRPPGGHGRLSLEELAPRLAHRAGAFAPCAPAALQRHAGRRPRRAAHRHAPAGQAAAAGRAGGGGRGGRVAAALAVVPERQLPLAAGAGRLPRRWPRPAASWRPTWPSAAYACKRACSPTWA